MPSALAGTMDDDDANGVDLESNGIAKPSNKGATGRRGGAGCNRLCRGDIHWTTDDACAVSATAVIRPAK